MSVREARFNDHWRRTFERVYPTRIETYSFESLQSFNNGCLTFSPGITAIVGGNGVGKSTLIAGIVEILSNGSAPVGVERSDRLSGCKGTASAFVDRGARSLSIGSVDSGAREPSGDSFDGNVRWVDPSAFSQSCVKQIRSDANFAELLESVTPATLDREELEVISFLTGKEYSECSIYEIGDYAGLEAFPYFQVNVGGEIYGSEGMGRGELSLFVSYWFLRDIPKCSVLILEEPETHVSPRSQDRLMDVVAKFCDERAIWVVAATHSPTIVRRIPPTNIRLITRDTAKASIIERPTSVQTAKVLSGGVAYKGMFLVEDVQAKIFLQIILEDLASDLLPQFEVVIAGDESSISRAIESLPLTEDWLTVLGVYDGDGRTRIDAEKFIWPHIFLPGEMPPEVELKLVLTSTHEALPEFATAIGKTMDQVRVGIEFIAGLDLHDWMEEFCSMVGREISIVRHVLVRMWIARNEESAKEFVAELRSKLQSIGR